MGNAGHAAAPRNLKKCPQDLMGTKRRLAKRPFFPDAMLVAVCLWTTMATMATMAIVERDLSTWCHVKHFKSQRLFKLWLVDMRSPYVSPRNLALTS